MATMRPLLRRVELSWICLLLVGALCGAVVTFGVDALRQSSHDATVPPVAMPVPAANNVLPGGRLGGIQSSDTATGWYLQHEFNPAAPQAQPAAASDNAPRIVGPGEGLNQNAAALPGAAGQ